MCNRKTKEKGGGGATLPSNEKAIKKHLDDYMQGNKI